MQLADSQMGLYLAKIDPGKEADYGFTEQDDLDACVVGKPYRIMELSKSFYSETIQPGISYINIENKWLVPIAINHQYRSLLTIKGNPGNLNVTSLGAAALAKELQLASLAVNDSEEFYLLRVPALSADFFVHEGGYSFSEARFLPLESATKAIPALSPGKEDYSLKEIQNIIKEQLTAKR